MTIKQNNELDMSYSDVKIKVEADTNHKKPRAELAAIDNSKKTGIAVNNDNIEISNTGTNNVWTPLESYLSTASNLVNGDGNGSIQTKSSIPYNEAIGQSAIALGRGNSVRGKGSVGIGGSAQYNWYLNGNNTDGYTLLLSNSTLNGSPIAPSQTDIETSLGMKYYLKYAAPALIGTKIRYNSNDEVIGTISECTASDDNDYTFIVKFAEDPGVIETTNVCFENNIVSGDYVTSIGSVNFVESKYTNVLGTNNYIQQPNKNVDGLSSIVGNGNVSIGRSHNIFGIKNYVQSSNNINGSNNVFGIGNNVTDFGSTVIGYKNKINHPTGNSSTVKIILGHSNEINGNFGSILVGDNNISNYTSYKAFGGNLNDYDVSNSRLSFIFGCYNTTYSPNVRGIIATGVDDTTRHNSIEFSVDSDNNHTTELKDKVKLGTIDDLEDRVNNTYTREEINDTLNDILGVEGANISNLVELLDDNNTATGILVELSNKADAKDVILGDAFETEVAKSSYNLPTKGDTVEVAIGKLTNILNQINSKLDIIIGDEYIES